MWERRPSRLVLVWVEGAQARSDEGARRLVKHVCSALLLSAIINAIGDTGKCQVVYSIYEVEGFESRVDSAIENAYRNELRKTYTALRNSLLQLYSSHKPSDWTLASYLISVVTSGVRLSSIMGCEKLKVKGVSSRKLSETCKQVSRELYGEEPDKLRQRMGKEFVDKVLCDDFVKWVRDALMEVHRRLRGHKAIVLLIAYDKPLYKHLPELVKTFKHRTGLCVEQLRTIYDACEKKGYEIVLEVIREILGL